MNKDKFCEELYSQFPEIIVPGKRGVLVPISMLVVGVALLFCDTAFANMETEIVRYASILIGTTLSLRGLTVLVVRLCNKRGLPYYVRTNKPLKFTEMSFSKEQMSKVKDLVDKGDISALRSMQQYPVSAVAVMVFSADNDEFVAMQAFTYAELDYHPITDKVYVN